MITSGHEKGTDLRLVVVCANLACLGFLILSAWVCPDEVTLWVYAAAQLIFYGSHWYYLKKSGNYDLMEGLNLINIGLFLHFFTGPLTVYYELIPTYYQFLWDMALFPKALVLIQAQLVMIQIGYYWAFGRFGKRPLFTEYLLSEPRFAFFILFFLFVPSIGSLIGTSLSSSGLFYMFQLVFIYFPFYLIILHPKKASLMTYILILVGLASSLYYSVFVGMGSKAGVASFFVAAFVYIHYFKKRFRIGGALAALTVVVLLVSFLNYVRAVGTFNEMAIEDINPFTEERIETFTGGGIGSLLTPFEGLMAILTTVPSTIPYHDGQWLAEEMIYPLVPRIFYPSKPEFYGSAVFWELHLGYLSLEHKVFESVSLPGHFYLDFGIPGILLGGLLLGIIQAWLYQKLVANGYSRGSICLYAIAVVPVLLSARGFAWTSQTIIVNIVFPYLIVAYMYVRPRANSAKTSPAFDSAGVVA